MVITHNMQAMNAQRRYNIITKGKSKNAERLSSGYRINKSADDAAGLSISEKMRGQIKGLNQASRNAQDGVSLIQTAEGALNEVHSILHRIDELAVQAANDVNQSEEREAIQEEIDLSLQEINRISKTTEFNKILVLKAKQFIDIGDEELGTHELGHRYKLKTHGGTERSVYGTNMDFSNVNSANIEELIGKGFTTTCTANCEQIFTFKFTAAISSTVSVSNNNMTVEIGVKDPDITKGKDIVDKIIELADSQQSSPPFDGYNKANGDLYIGHANGLTSDGNKLYFYSINGGPPYAEGMGLLKAHDMVKMESNIFFQVGANEGQRVPYTIKTITASTLGIDKLDVTTHANAGKAISAIQKAVESVSEYRGYVGAMQNRLEHVISIDDIAEENLQASESRIRDVDMAREMVEYSKNNILEQVAQSIMAQANAANQSIVNLLQ